MTESNIHQVLKDVDSSVLSTLETLNTHYWLLLDKDDSVIQTSDLLAYRTQAKREPVDLNWNAVMGVEDVATIHAVNSLIGQAHVSGEPCTSKNFFVCIETVSEPLAVCVFPRKGDTSVLLTFTSITSNNKLAFAALKQTYRQLLQRLTVTLRSINEGVITTDTRGIVEFINPKAELITGWLAKDAVGKPIEQVIQLLRERDESPLPFPIQEVLNTNLPIGREHGVLLRTPAGNKHPISFNLSPILNDNYEELGTVLTLEDISQKLRIEEELQKIHKMDSLAILSAGIAHDFNNFLTSIMGNLSLARNSLDPEHRLYSILKNAERGTQHAKLLTDRLYSFSKVTSVLKKPCCIKSLLKDTANFILSGTETRWKSSFSEKLWACEIDEGQISQVLNNLLINANQAMPTGGVITIQARNRTMLWDSALALANGPYVEIKIIDQGSGIERQYLPKLFEPYFTTKPKGNGLGLATSYSIIKSHEGHIEVSSTVGVGTTFTLFLPANPEHKIIPQDERQTKVLQGVGHILVMDDDELVQDISGQMLMHLGYTVEFATSGEEALEKYKQAEANGTPISLILLDLSVGQGSGGTAALKLLRAYDPAVKTILCSGYSHREEVRFFDQHGFNGVIIKPYNIEQLSWAIQQNIG